MELKQVLETAWIYLAEGVFDRRALFHVPTVASICVDQKPSVSAVVLRGVNKSRRLIWFHTDKRAGKYKQLLSNPFLAFHFYDEAKKVQIRLQTSAILHICDEVTVEAWSKSQPISRLCYATPVTPGTTVSTPPAAPKLQEINTEIGYQNFCVIEGSISCPEWLQPSAEGHKRAVFQWAKDGELFSEWVGP